MNGRDTGLLSSDPQGLALDAQAVSRLRYAANQQAPDALKASAKQFEALFIHMMLKSMREASAAAGTDTSQDQQVYTSMLDQQLSQVMAQRGIGLADMMLQQLQRSPQGSAGLSSPSAAPATNEATAMFVPTGVPSAVALRSATDMATDAHLPSGGPATELTHVTAFRQVLQGPAEQAARLTGLPASFILGQAALESGWGRKQIRAEDGRSTHNVFGIKAGPDWKGEVAEVTTTEYIDGQPSKRVARFRAYASYDEAFRDYAELLLKTPRYQAVLAQGQQLDGFSQGLQKAGYATDPAYADKLSRLIRRYLLA